MTSNNKIVYFLGIGGIGMSALARFYLSQEYTVYGYDLTETPLTESLSKEGMIISYDDSVAAIPKDILQNRDAKVIYTPAIPADHPAFCYLKDESYTLIKRSEALGELTRDFRTIAVAGTHGKTTTTAIAAHILNHSKLKAVSFVGGLMSGYESNIILDKNPEWVLVEADEFDRSFLRLSPELLGITSVDADHLDIYNDEESLVESFNELTKKVKSAENRFVCDEVTASLEESIKYGFSEKANIRMQSKGYENGFHKIMLSGLVEKEFLLEVPMPGNHNALNAVLAVCLCYKAGCDLKTIVESVKTFQGVKRRFEYIINNDKRIFIDDYAHHPTEIKALIDAVRHLYPKKKIAGIFQPHLFSRTQDFADDFAESLSQLDTLYLLDIYPAREKPIPGIDSKMLLEKVELNEKSIVNKENLPVLISSTNHEILLTIGAGDIAQLVPSVKQAVINSIDRNEQ